MIESLIPMVVMTGMFAMIFGIVYIRSRENMAMVEKGINPRQKDPRPRPFVNLKWGLLLIGSGLGLLFAYIIDNTIMPHNKERAHSSLTIGGHHVHKHGLSIVIDDTAHGAKDTVTLSHTAPVKKENGDNDDEDDDDHSVTTYKSSDADSPALYFALVAIGGGLGLFFSYRIEKKEWLDKKIEA